MINQFVMSSILSNVLPAPEDHVLSVHIFQFKDLHPSYFFVIGSILPFYERVDHLLLNAFNLYLYGHKTGYFCL